MSRNILGDPVILARFEALIMPVPMCGCWLWMGAPCDASKTGQYGRFRIPGEGQQRSHRVSWQLYRGPIPAGLEVLHHCDIQPCVNPAHLFLGTNDDNVADRVAKGRTGYQARPGEAHPMHRLTEIDVRTIRTRYAEGEAGRALAAEFAINPATVSEIVHFRKWGHLR
jgi:HNH endonuclease